MCKIFLCFLLILINITLSSCKYESCYLNENQKIKKWEQHKKSLLKILSYQARGLVICSLLNDNKKIYIYFFVQKIDHNFYQVIFRDFIGLTNIKITLNENKECSVYNKEENYLSYQDCEIMIKKLVNIDIPCKNFNKWILGLPGSSSEFSIDIHGYLKNIHYQFNNSNFTILYKSYLNHLNQVLPNIIEIYCNKKYYLYIKIYNWVVF